MSESSCSHGRSDKCQNLEKHMLRDESEVLTLVSASTLRRLGRSHTPTLAVADAVRRGAAVPQCAWVEGLAEEHGGGGCNREPYAVL